MLGFLSLVTIAALEALPLSLAGMGGGLVIGMAISIVPLRAILVRRAGSSPWWWDALFWSVVGTAVLGASIDEPVIMLMGLSASLLFVAAIAFGTWLIEARYGVRTYSKARGFVFVSDN